MVKAKIYRKPISEKKRKAALENIKRAQYAKQLKKVELARKERMSALREKAKTAPRPHYKQMYNIATRYLKQEHNKFVVLHNKKPRTKKQPLKTLKEVREIVLENVKPRRKR